MNKSKQKASKQTAEPVFLHLRQASSLPLILKIKDEQDLKQDNSSVIDAHVFQQSSSNIDYYLSILPRSRFIEEQLPNDLVRVDTLFQKAMQAGINIQCRSIGGEEIAILILSGKYIAIALVDHNKLNYSHVWQEEVHVPGHYVLICGYDAGSDMFEIRDPASSKDHKRISSRSLEEARKAFRTDEDLLLISLDKSKNRDQHCVCNYQLMSTLVRDFLFSLLQRFAGHFASLLLHISHITRR